MQPKGKHLVYCVLNWGLGHATRSVPVIRHAITSGYRVTIASDGYVLDFLGNEFPGCRLLELPGYNIRYPYGSVLLNALLSFGPAVFKSISAEHKALDSCIEDDPADLVISDNRYGCYSRQCPSVLITHQLHIRGMWRIAARIGDHYIKRWATRFKMLWIPDFEDRQKSIGGAISKPIKGIPYMYLGLLSSFHKIPGEEKYDLLVVLSGPEPQRTKFEQRILDQLGGLSEKRICIVRGKPGNDLPVLHSARHRTIPILQRDALNQLMEESRYVLCRSGYSSIMDLVFLNKQAILIPTPGQPEQIYLARRLSGHPLFVIATQDDFRLSVLLRALEQKPGLEDSRDFAGAMDQAIADAFLSLGTQKQELDHTT